MAFIEFLTRLFKNKKDNNMDDQTTMPEQKSQQKRKHKLEIQVYEADYEKADANNGQPQWRPVNYGMDNGRPIVIEVADQKELVEIQKQYAMCDQRIKVVREIDPFVDDNSSQPSTIPQNNQAIPIAKQTAQIAVNSHTQQSAKPSIDASTPTKPKIVMIGDIEVKYDGSKVYQKQWMKLTQTEARNFRIVNDSTNKVVNMNGKHIEAKRWTLIEDSTSNLDDDGIETLIEG